MKTKLLFLLLFAFCAMNAQKIKPKEDKPKLTSVTRSFIDNSKKTRINKDWSLEAEFKSGIGETVTFYPVQIVDLDTRKEINAIELVMFTKAQAGLVMVPQTQSVWIDYDEVESFIAFIEDNIVPNINLKFRDKSSEFIFQAKEITLKFLVHERRQRLTIEINNADNAPFWTESQVDNFPKLLPMLKKVKNKELKF